MDATKPMQNILAMIRSLRESEFIKPFIFFILMHIVFWICIEFRWLPEKIQSAPKLNLVTAFCFFSVSALLIFNTVIFLINANKVMRSLVEKVDDTRLKNEIDINNGTFIITMIFSVIASTGSAFCIVFWLFSENPIDVGRITSISKYLVVFVFTLFLLADTLCYSVVNKTIGKLTCDADFVSSTLKFKRSVRTYILAIDAPGLAGALLILVFSRILDQTNGVDVIANELDRSYWHGFLVGAMSLHLALTQFALFFLGVPERQPSDVEVA